MYKMKKNRRIIALIMVFALIFAFMAINISAATPRGLACNECGSSNTTTTNAGRVRVGTQWVNGCSKYPAVGHDHNIYQPVKKFQCHSCGDYYHYNYGSTYLECTG